MDDLHAVIQRCPVIDNHGHNLFKTEHLNSQPFEAVVTEAEGSALKDSLKSVAHIRAENQLRQLYNCEPDADWDAILKKRAEFMRDDLATLQETCLQGTYAILMDDGQSESKTYNPYTWHNRLTSAPTKRIVRIETAAELIIQDILQNATERDLADPQYLVNTWALFTDRFEAEILASVKDDEVAGFKSVVCYRTGLDIEPDYNESLLHIAKPFELYVTRCIRKKRYRLQRKAMSDYIILKTLEVISEQAPHNRVSKPLQFHTGLGDADISLTRSNPAYLQSVIERYPNVPFVLLHAAYPYTRQGGYLATMYKNVFLDLGLVFPMLSRDGQLCLLRQCLELVPGGKLLYSSGARYFPEAYWLANRQFREALEEILEEQIERGDLTPTQAISFAMDVMFNNANTVYDLRYQVDLRKKIASAPDGPSLWSHKLPAKNFGSSILEKFLQQKSQTDVRFFYIQWLDYLGMVQTKILPLVSFKHLVSSNGKIEIAQLNINALQETVISPASGSTSPIYLEPDLSTLRPCQKKDPLAATKCLGFWCDETGKPSLGCPRTGLLAKLNELSISHALNLLISFDIEVTFVSRNDKSRNATEIYDPYIPLTLSHTWSSLSPEGWQYLPLVTEIVDTLSEVGIEIQQFSAGAAPGQFEFALPPLPPLQAIDILIQSRLVIAQISATHGLRATLHPRPFPGVQTKACATVTMLPAFTHQEMQFWVGGVLNHAEALSAFCMAQSVSYPDVPGDYSDDESWVAWGTHNRDTPLRKTGVGRWEIRFLDGMANMYLAISTIIGAGLLGLKEALSMDDLQEKDCPYNPSTLPPDQRLAFGITRKMPLDIRAALEALQHDQQLREMLPPAVSRDYLILKRAEQNQLASMDEHDRRIWLIERF